jgi:trimethylamine--corrinoid protein Co-methyltransferase
MRPKVKFLTDELIKKIINEAIEILCKLGVEINNQNVLSLLSDNGARIEKNRVYFTEDIIQKALKTAPNSFKLYDVNGNETNNFSGDNVHFTPGSAALHILDHQTKKIRNPSTRDYIDYVKVVSQLKHIASQSTALIPNDVHEQISDSYRLFLSLLYCEKPVVTGTFTIESFEIMKDFQLAVRGNETKLKENPLTVFSCCPTSPLEFIAMPLSGFIAPVTLTGSLIQHTAETLSGIVISQLANPGTPMLYGGSPAIFDVRYETTPMGAVETMMIDCAYNEIGKFLGIPTQAYISLSDAKQLDAQAGLESGMGATLATLSGINNISGPGMLDFESCISLEKLVMDNEICGMNLRMIEGIEPKEDFPSIPIFEELLKENHLLISKHTRKYLKKEHYFPGEVINRANRPRWIAEGKTTLEERAHTQVEKLIQNYEPSSLSNEVKKDLTKLMENEAKKYGQDKLPIGKS